jgi:hypothetical protein
MNMPRRKAIPMSIDTQYFKDVTPLWQPPDQPSIKEKYHDGTLALAEWAGPEWADNDQTDFFLIRSVVIDTCESWISYDWDGDEAWIAERKVDAKFLPSLARSAFELSRMFEKGRFRAIKKNLVREILVELGIDVPRALTNADAIAALERSIERFAEWTKIDDNAHARYGAIEYHDLPDRLPRREIAIALSLADRITFFRKDGYSSGSLSTPHPPNISTNLPWKAIALFASANIVDPYMEIGPSNVQTLVTSLSEHVARVHWR